MGTSLCSVDYWVHLFDKLSPIYILDAGNGFSSLAFHSTHDIVNTVDEDPDCDFVFYHYGDIETGYYCFETILFLCNTIIYLDDFHVSSYRDYIFSRAKQFEIISLKDKISDEFERHRTLLIKERKLIDVL